MWSGLSKYSDVGLLLVRVGLGITFVLHGLGKFRMGSEVLTAVGSTMGNLGITLGHYFFGILAASGEMIGGLLLLIGAFFRPACLLLLWIMAMAVLTHAVRGDGFKGYAHALELGIVFLGLFFVGPGKLSIDRQ